MKFLFISGSFIRDFQTNVHGVFKRMHMFIDAIKEIATLDVLFFVRPDIDVSPSNITQLERNFSDHWGVKIRLFLCPMQKTNDEGSIPGLWHKFGAGSISFFGQPAYRVTSGKKQVRALEDALKNEPNAIFAHKLQAMCPLLLTKKTLPPVYFDIDDIEHITFTRGIKQLNNWYSRIPRYAQLPMLLSGERRAIRLAHKTFVCSDADRNYLTDCRRLSGVVTVPNAVTIPERQKLTSDPTILFLGSYKYRPNIEAAEFLIEKVWPRIYNAMPGARLIIAGYHPEEIRYYDRVTPGVTFTGFVEDIESLYLGARIVCAPIFVGGGTRLKIIEAAAYGKPIISNRIGAEGLDFRDGYELLLRNDAKSIAEACLQLLRDYSLCETLGTTAREMALKLYDRKNILQLIQQYMKQ
jgi:glycosyltransferase involved in cell wall biosynthesis